MAELLGVVAGGAGLASLALQLGESAKQIRSFYKSYKKAPEALQDLVFDMETFQMLLWEIDQERQLHNSASLLALDRCLQMCQRSIDNISRVVSKLELALQRAKIFGRIRATVEEKDIVQICEQLGRSMNSLGLAFQLYTMSQRRREENAHFQKLTSRIEHAPVRVSTDTRSGSRNMTIEACSNEDEHAISRTMEFSNGSGQHYYGRKERRRFHVHLRPFFASWIWELTMRQSCAGWSLAFQTFYAIPSDSPIFYFVEHGDLTAVQKIFACGAASPTVYRDSGTTHEDLLLPLACSSGNPELCRFILSMLPRSGLEYRELYYVYLHRTRKRDAEDIYRLLLADADIDPERLVGPKRFAGPFGWYTFADKECMQLVQNSCPEIMTDMTLCGNLTMAYNLNTVRRNVFDVAAFLQAARCPNIDQAFATRQDLLGRTALHAVAKEFHHVHEDHRGSLVRFVRDLVNAGANLHQTDTFGKTALGWYLYFWHHLACTKFRDWLSLLFDAGVDLVRYGAAEVDIASSSRSGFLQFGPSRLWHAGLTIGPLPGDWDLCVYYADLVTTVWEQVPTPGAWPVDDDAERLPSQICWQPEDEDHEPCQDWTLIREIDWQASAFFVSAFEEHMPRLRLWEKCQDDASVIALALDKPSRGTHPRRRSSSQPPMGRLQKHDEIDSLFQSQLRYRRDWPFSKEAHLCDMGMGQRLIPSRSDYTGLSAACHSPRQCLKINEDRISINDWYIQYRLREHRQKIAAEEFLAELGT